MSFWVSFLEARSSLHLRPKSICRTALLAIGFYVSNDGTFKESFHMWCVFFIWEKFCTLSPFIHWNILLQDCSFQNIIWQALRVGILGIPKQCVLFRNPFYKLHLKPSPPLYFHLLSALAMYQFCDWETCKKLVWCIGSFSGEKDDIDASIYNQHQPFPKDKPPGRQRGFLCNQCFGLYHFSSDQIGIKGKRRKKPEKKYSNFQDFFWKQIDYHQLPTIRHLVRLIWVWM